MPRSRSKRRQSDEVDDEASSPARSRRRSNASQEEEDDEDEAVEPNFCFSSQAPEASQSIQAEKPSERSMFLKKIVLFQYVPGRVNA